MGEGMGGGLLVEGGGGGLLDTLGSLVFGWACHETS